MEGVQSFIDVNNGSNSKRAIFPIIKQAEFEFDGAVATNEGSVQKSLIAIATGLQAGYGGKFTAKGCKDLKVTVTYIGGDDCQPCNDPDALTTQDITFTVPKNSVYTMPNGFWKEVKIQLVDDAGVAVNLSASLKEQVDFFSTYTPEHPDYIVLVP